MHQPIIASVPSDSETAYAVKKAKCGIVVEPGDIDELAKAIIELKINPKLRRKTGLEGQSFLKNNMNLEKNVKTYESVFESILHSIN